MSITTFETENFSFGSTNPVKTETVKTMFLESGLSVDKIKNNNVEDRHRLMRDLTCWGHCSITRSYWEARELRDNLYRDLINSLPKNHSNRVLWRGSVGLAMVAGKVFDLTGWKF